MSIPVILYKPKGGHMAIKCKCISAERDSFISAVWEGTENMPDGAFFAVMEENEIDVSELEVYSAEHIKTCKNL